MLERIMTRGARLVTRAAVLQLMFLLPSAHAQQATAPAPRSAQQSGQVMGGSSTAGAHPPVYDAEHRPITLGGIVKTGPTLFVESAAKAGLGSWSHRMGTPGKSQILETVGSGVALLDYDNDGWLDIYLVNGSTAEAMAGKAPAPRAALFHNNHDGTFSDVTAKAGVANERWGFGAVVGDYDNDGWPDLFISNFGKNRLFHNNHNGTFTDVAETAGVALGNWSTGATFGDFDGDGRLDLFVPGYVHYDAASLIQPAGRMPESSSVPCTFRGVRVMCGPRGLKGEPDHLFHNNGNGTFTDVSEKAGVTDKAAYYGLASVFLDINNDGKLDLLVANDSTPNYLYLNKGDGTFEDASFTSGYALNESGRETASMGIASGDYRHSGLLDIFNTTFSDDYKPLYRNDGGGNLTDIAYQAGIASPTVPFLGWGDAFFDYDNDGWLDLMLVNGHVYPAVDRQEWGTSFAQRPLLFHNDRGRLSLISPVEGSGLARATVARGMAVGDLLNEGSLDVVVNNMDAVPSLLRNVATRDPARTRPHWIAFQLVGGPKSPRDAIGTTIYVTAGGFRQRADVIAGGSFASSSDPRPHFGLAAAKRVDSIEIHWPDGAIQHVEPPPSVDRFYRIIEGSRPEAIH